MSVFVVVEEFVVAAAYGTGGSAASAAVVRHVDDVSVVGDSQGVDFFEE